ncbi:D-glycero-alpha-D-manno-heptose-1,7-bisphosphate 7-phosphatase [Dinghuibacter silviterrae]|uniref:D,D-heptose 1,7-bisphosphate phosphatase n=1 Tax=Dinghuibacter silviterrae TaxID=1539049 RepID=A0A4V3GM69_9BACT|nr:HAD-IIIA family hydrolase [Dinghuibacter silviterrae]TDX02303.1 D-glycero-D-manno-heptose 1,7-bisphosphate phosphatase [Dinghuibacter silviterrae]
MSQPILPRIDRSWTLFLDRDGVINVEKPMDYVRTWEEFQFNAGVLEAFRIFKGHFGHLFVVTNQRGVGKGLMTEEDLLDIHERMTAKVVLAGGHIDHIYYAPDLNDDSPRRKPGPLMGQEAIRDFAGVDPRRSLMVGNTFSDMEFGRNIGALTVFLPTTREEPPMPHPLVDFIFPDLLAFARAINAGGPGQ